MYESAGTEYADDVCDRYETSPWSSAMSPVPNTVTCVSAVSDVTAMSAVTTAMAVGMVMMSAMSATTVAMVM